MECVVRRELYGNKEYSLIDTKQFIQYLFVILFLGLPLDATDPSAVLGHDGAGGIASGTVISVKTELLAESGFPQMVRRNRGCV